MRGDTRRGRLLLLVSIAVVALVLVGLWLLGRIDSARPAPAPGASPQAGATAQPADDASVRVFFTTPRYPDDRSTHFGGPDEQLELLMDRATRTLDVAVYDFDLQNVAQAMARAAERGVRVRMVTDTDTVNNTRNQPVADAFDTLRRAKIPVVEDNRGAIMHHKFSVADGEWVSTGSMNYTDGDAYRLNNSLAVIRSRQLAENYTAEFEKLFTKRQFGPAKPPGVPFPNLDLAGSEAQTLFAPQDEVASHLVTWLGQARQSIHFLAFSFTRDDMADAMLARAKDGVELQGVFETQGSNTQFSEYGTLKQGGADVYQDGNPYVMHHKVIILDSRRVLIGSYNFSTNADEDNDENVLMLDDHAVAAQFEAEFQRVLGVARNPPNR